MKNSFEIIRIKKVFYRTSRYMILIIVILFSDYLTFSQSDGQDSLKSLLVQSKHDTNRVYLLIELSKHNARISPDEAINYGLEADSIADNLNFKKGRALALKYIGMAYYFQAKYLETIQYWKQSHDVFEALGDTKGVANMLSNIGAIYFNQGDDTKAIEMYLRTLKVAETIGDTLRIATVLNNIGGVYNNKDATRDKAISYFLRAYELSKQIKDQEAIGTSAVNAGGYYLIKKNADSALYYFDNSLIAIKQTVRGNIAYVLNNIGEAYALKKDYAQAKKYQNEALEIATNNNSALDMTLALISLGNTYHDEGNYETAIKYYQRAEAIASNIGVNYQLEKIYISLALSYASQLDYEQAFKYQKLYSEIKDTLYNAENDKKIQRLQFNYEIDKKQGEVDLLLKDKEIKDLAIKQQKLIRNALIVFLVLVLIITIGAIRNYLNKVKINKILDRQKDEIERLLLNILPASIAKELTINGYAVPRSYEHVTVLFTDFKDFTKISSGMTPEDLVEELNTFFNAFDSIIETHNLEKIKTIGDAYMCAGGIPNINNTHPIDAVKAGIAMQEFMHKINQKRIAEGKTQWNLRVGIHTGSLVAGVVGKKKYAYDIWGDTVNIASRMESNGEAGKVNISSATYELIKDRFVCYYRGKISAKNVGEIDMYFIESEIKANSELIVISA